MRIALRTAVVAALLGTGCRSYSSEEEGLSVTEAIVNASPTRLRPILMTTISTIAGAIPAALSLDLNWMGLGAAGGMELRAPMAVAVIGGLILSALPTLFVVSAVYAMFEDLKSLFGLGRKPAAVPVQPREGQA